MHVGGILRKLRVMGMDEENHLREVFADGGKLSVIRNDAERLCKVRTDRFYVQFLSFSS